MPDPLVTDDFAPPRGWRSGHLQTVRSRVVPRHVDLDSLARTRVALLDLGDGSGDRIAITLHEPVRPEPGHPVGVVVHGLGGSAESDYVRATAAGLLRAGLTVARVDLRGAGRSLEHSTELYHAGRPEDLRAVLRALATRVPAAANGLAPVGFSLGGNLVLKLLGEPLEGLPVRAGVAVSAPLDLAVGVAHLHRMAFGAYEQVLLRGLRRDMLARPDGLSDEERRGLRAVRTIEEFDTLITARRNGWRDAAAYYAASSSGQFLPRITVPTLVVHALDDPMVPAGPYRAVDWDALPTVRRAVTPHGGHVGFHQRGGLPPWYVEQTVTFLRQTAAD